MATTTTNYGLTKPGYGDAADIAVINENMDKIDDALDAKDRSMAVVNDGDTAEANIDEGALVYVRGHSTLADGLYKAVEAITSGTTLTGNILTATSVSEQFSDVSRKRLVKTYYTGTSDGTGKCFIEIDPEKVVNIIPVLSGDNKYSGLVVYGTQTQTGKVAFFMYDTNLNIRKSFTFKVDVWTWEDITPS